MKTYELYQVLAKAALAEEYAARLRVAIEADAPKEELAAKAVDIMNLLIDVKVHFEQETFNRLTERKEK